MESEKLRTFVYVDGFNLYNRALVKTPFKWLDLRRFTERLLSPRNQVERIKYFMAMVSGRRDPKQPERQQIYLRALATIPGLSIHYGTFLPKTIRRPLVNPPCQCSCCTYVDVHTTEEKGSDVNLASHLVWDGLRGHFEAAVVISKDTDLVEPIRLVVQEGLAVGVICPEGQTPTGLARVASFARHITRSDLANAQLPDPIISTRGKLLRKPVEWC